MMKHIAILAALLLTSAATQASGRVTISSDVFVERTTVTSNDGSAQIKLEQPTTVVPGDKLLFVVEFRNTGSNAATDFSVTNPIASAVALSKRVIARN